MARHTDSRERSRGQRPTWCSPCRSASRRLEAEVGPNRLEALTHAAAGLLLLLLLLAQALLVLPAPLPSLPPPAAASAEKGPAGLEDWPRLTATDRDRRLVLPGDTRPLHGQRGEPRGRPRQSRFGDGGAARGRLARDGSAGARGRRGARLAAARRRCRPLGRSRLWSRPPPRRAAGERHRRSVRYTPPLRMRCRRRLRSLGAPRRRRRRGCRAAAAAARRRATGARLGRRGEARAARLAAGAPAESEIGGDLQRASQCSPCSLVL